MTAIIGAIAFSIVIVLSILIICGLPPWIIQITNVRGKMTIPQTKNANHLSSI